ncbi:hypothetical protein KAR34_07365 [bacterium]|nr:hypothetical protein [bacterium]
MSILSRLTGVYGHWQQKQIIRLLTQSDPDKIMAYGEKQLIPAFQRLSISVADYRGFQIIKKPAHKTADSAEEADQAE